MAITKLTIAVPTQWLDHPRVQALAALGHTIVPIDVSAFNILLAPQAHQWNEYMWDFEKAMLTRARKHKKEGNAL